MCIHLWKIGIPKDREAPGKCEYCGEERMFDGTFPPKRYDFRRPDKQKPKMSQTDRDVGGVFAGLPRPERL